MAVSPLNVGNLTQEALVKTLVESLEYNLQVARIWQFVGVPGGKLRYERTNQLEAIGAIDSMATILGDGTTGITLKTPGADTSETFTVGELATRAEIDISGQDRFRFQSIQDAVSIILCKRLFYMAFRKLDKVNTAANGDYDSLFDMCAASQIVAGGGVAPTLALLQQTYHLVTAGLALPNCIMCNDRGSRAIIAAYNAAGLHPLQVEMEWDCPLTGRKRKQMMNSINGTPILRNNMIATTGANKTKIYMMVAGQDCKNNVHGVFGIVPKDMENKLFIRRETNEPSGVTTTSKMNLTYTFPVGTAMGCESALAILDDVLV